MAKAKDKLKQKRSTPRNPNSAFVQNLKKLMKDNGYTYKDIAMFAGRIPVTTVFSWSEGHNPKIDAIYQLTKTLKLDFKWFLTGEAQEVKAQSRVEDFFEEDGVEKEGIYKVTLTRLIPRGSKLPSKK